MMKLNQKLRPKSDNGGQAGGSNIAYYSGEELKNDDMIISAGWESLKFCLLQSF